MQSEKQGHLRLSFLYFKGEICIALFALFVMFLTSAFTGCGDDVKNTYSACPELYTLQDGECVKIVDSELECGASRTFQITYLDGATKKPILYPITSTMQNRETLDDSNGRHRLNDPDGVQLYDNIVLCDEYQLSAASTCYATLDRVDFQVPMSTIYTIEMQPKLFCNDSELDIAFAECLVGEVPVGYCCMAFVQQQFDLQCGRL